METLLLAISVASVMAAVGTPFRIYECWWSWNRKVAAVGLVLYFVVGGGGSGLVGWLGGQVTGAVASSDWRLRGVLFGLTGAALVRAALPVKPNEGKSGTAVQQTVSALGWLLSYIRDLLDEKTRTTSQNWFNALADDDLLFQSQQIRAHILSRGLSDRDAMKIVRKFAEAAQKIRVQADRDEGRAQMSTFCAFYVAGEHLSKGIFVSTGRTRRLPGL